MTRGKREHQRYRVHLTVRYGVATEFISRHADNLSLGGMFIKGAHELAPEQRVTVEIDLPGYRRFKVDAIVVHVTTPEQAAATGSAPGVGLKMTELPSAFDDAIGGYLATLEQRAERMVLVAYQPLALILTNAGYQTRPAPLPGALIATIARAPVRVIAVIVPGSGVADYLAAAKTAGAGELIIAADGVDEVDNLLVRLDEEL